MNIKEKNIGAGRPLVCVPIVEKTKETIMKKANELASGAADMIEWRMDWYEECEKAEALCAVSNKLAEIFKDKILLCTFRSKAQGGEKEISKEDYVKMLQHLAQHGNMDMLDIEVYELEHPEELIGELKQQGIVTVASEHDFTKTPPAEVMTAKLLHMKNMGADIGKLAVMPNDRNDVLHLMEATVEVKEQYPDYPIITMSMGKTGMISRIAGQFSGSCVTFATAGKASAPGQLPLEDAVMILNKISESMEK